MFANIPCCSTELSIKLCLKSYPEETVESIKSSRDVVERTHNFDLRESSVTDNFCYCMLDIINVLHFVICLKKSVGR